MVAVSFNPREGPGLASQKKAAYVERYGRPHTASGWHFLTGEEPSIDALTEAVGFRYAYDDAIKQYAHGAAIEVLTPKGHISKYFYGIEFSARDLRLGLIEASDERIGTPIDDFLLFCYHYDPATGKYGAAVLRWSAWAESAHRAGVSLVPDDQPPAGPTSRGGRPGVPNLTMSSTLPLFPQQASVQAGQVDAIYFFMVAVTAFFSLLIAGLIVFFAIKFRRRSR